jgi:hypothetical protein
MFYQELVIPVWLRTTGYFKVVNTVEVDAFIFRIRLVTVRYTRYRRPIVTLLLVEDCTRKSQVSSESTLGRNVSVSAPSGVVCTPYRCKPQENHIVFRISRYSPAEKEASIYLVIERVSKVPLFQQ